MPCAFEDQATMLIHTSAALQHVANLSGDVPYILTGDWNTKPGDISYDLITKGKIDNKHPSHPGRNPLTKFQWVQDPQDSTKTIKKNISFKFDAQINPLESAYYTALGKEPEFTNYVNSALRVKEGVVFCSTLDYLFYSSGGWKVLDVERLPKLSDVDGTFPNAEQPSDHLLLAATFEL
eukprot:TRINITY_DN4590_c0_g1_i1.p1 TRINITY_DN4590_c0_g1~~TRINITY_DN4590_c0_g1_i1.p1  ORF type:complete len:179 (-),score=28.37 TRINITY_DN4590_c0_g1_i1:24-560(-)